MIYHSVRAIYFGDKDLKQYNGEAWSIGNGNYIFRSDAGEQFTTSFYRRVL